MKPNSKHATPHYSKGWRRSGTLIIATLLTAWIVSFASEARAQCTARDVLSNRLRSEKTPLTTAATIPIRSAAEASVWKTIKVGTFADSFALIDALQAAGCGIGDLAGEILARPAFALSATKRNVDLFAISAAELGFQTDTVPLAEIYARAQRAGFGFAAAEIGPQLRLQYLDQPIGEFLIIGMEPIKTWKGEPVILTVANGGAGLILIGQDGRADTQIWAASRFLFVRPDGADGLKAAATLLPP
jgi:hypothetical protein